MRICLFRTKALVDIVNLTTLQGVNEVISCLGFDEKGNPIRRAKDLKNAPYKVSGSYYGGISIPDGDLATFLGITEDEASELLKGKEGTNRIFFYRQHQTYGMLKPYLADSDVWVSDLNPPELDYDAFNKLLAEIGSEWRINTPMVRKVLLKLQMERILNA